jgi:two-component system NtrC family response regulator
MGRYHWPGNERQLENEVKRLAASVRGRSITEDNLDTQIRASQYVTAPSQALLPVTSLPDAVAELERRMIEAALRKSGGNKQKAAQTLGMSRQGLLKKIARFGIPAL